MADHLQSQIRQLEDLSRVQQVFVSDVSHELRTPLTTIRMAADVIHDRRGDFTPDLARSAELLNTELDRFEELLADLLEISRFDAGAANLEADPVDLGRHRPAGRPGGRPPGARARAAPSRWWTPPARSSPRSTPAGSNASCATSSSTRSNTARDCRSRHHGRPERQRGGDRRPRPRRRSAAGRGGARLQPVLAGRPRQGPHHRGDRPGPGDLLEDARLHNGWLQAWGRPGEGSVFRLTLPRAASGPDRILPAARSRPPIPDPTRRPRSFAPVSATGCAVRRMPTGALRGGRGHALAADGLPRHPSDTTVHTGLGVAAQCRIQAVYLPAGPTPGAVPGGDHPRIPACRRGDGRAPSPSPSPSSPSRWSRLGIPG